ncbi:MAG: helix-turn-helix transcriptional regulator [Pseudobdellovibrionaceae bacterium]|nr:helix-turn-helix transcriptional regulator [Bdellovibrionales bacterium]USN46506.1 MAG: helix-turn-helix transcriptional regulator [Pseudobdellovibrionaceae bacterium]
MSDFITTDEQKVKIYTIAATMKQSGLSDRFISSAVRLAEYYEGVFDLFELWAEEEGSQEKKSIIADIQEEIDEFREQPNEPLKKPYISYKDLEGISKDIRSYKDFLRSKVDKWGGITKLAAETGIPQPSLSRFFSSNSMPRRTTIYKIANALNLSEAEVIAEWAA